MVVNRERQKSQALISDDAQKPIFDRQQFEDNTMSDRTLQQEILFLFLAQIQDVRKKLNEGPVSMEESRFLGHTLRGAAAAVGATDFVLIAENWENLALEGQSLQTALDKSEISFRKTISHYLA